ncbi:MAG TPA: DUF969 domain-containing protein [Clostridiaceae bacterium]|nr:DUF969 domain-containing protein [Clostridiaceae bacterium]
MIKLIGVLIIVVGFALKLDAIGIVITAGVVTGLVGGISFPQILDILGKTFVANRYMSIFLMLLPVIGILEKNGLKETAGKFISKIKNASPGKVIISYGVVRAFLAAFDISFGGVAGFVRPVVYPMAVGSVESKGKKISEEDAETIKAMSAGMENVAWFFGQTLFIAGAGLLLVQGTLKSAGYELDPIKAVKAEIPVAIIAVLVASIYYGIIDKKIMKKYTNKKAKSEVN